MFITMSMSVIKWENDAEILDTFDLGLIYFVSTYKEVVNKRGYNFESLISQVGGFVGRQPI